MKTHIGQKRLFSLLAGRQDSARVKSINGVGIKSARSSVLKKLRECAKLNTKWTRQTLLVDNRTKFRADLNEISDTSSVNKGKEIFKNINIQYSKWKGEEQEFSSRSESDSEDDSDSGSS